MAEKMIEVVTTGNVKHNGVTYPENTKLTMREEDAAAIPWAVQQLRAPAAAPEPEASEDDETNVDEGLDVLTAEQVAKMTGPKLKAALKARSLAISGRVGDLKDRLLEAIANEGG